MAKRSKSKTTKVFSMKNKGSIEPVEEIKELMDTVNNQLPDYAKLKTQEEVQNGETAAASETVQELVVEAATVSGIMAEAAIVSGIMADTAPMGILTETEQQNETVANGEIAGSGINEVELPDREPEDFEEDKYLTIKQLAIILQVELSTVRHWEKEFAEYLGQAVLKNQRKLFTARQLEIFTKIKDLLKTEQYTIEGAKRRLELDNILSNSLGVEHNFKTTVFIMLSAIMQELQSSRQESRELARQVAKLQLEKNQVEEKLEEEQNKGLLDFLKTKLNKRNPVGKEA